MHPLLRFHGSVFSERVELLLLLFLPRLAILVRIENQMIGGHAAIVFLNNCGASGSLLLDHCTAIVIRRRLQYQLFSRTHQLPVHDKSTTNNRRLCRTRGALTGCLISFQG